ncbi:MAG: WD40 repeat domain-containing protein, partial [Methylobacter sp.]
MFSPKEPRDLLAGSLVILDSAMRPGDPGFLVLPQEESALAAWSTWLSSGQMPVIVPAEAQRFPRLIAGQGEQRYLDDAAPDAAEVARLIAELHVYLGENGFYWLCCCAIPPLLRTGLTLLLGEEYLRRAGVSNEEKLRYHLARNYRLLIRLPWLRHNHMPDWLRLALLLRLSPPLQEEMRDVVEVLLARQSPDASGSLPLGFDAPKAGAAVGAGCENQSSQHALYLGFMSGLSARQLQLRIPGPWQFWLNRLDSRPQPLRRWRDWLAASFARLLFRGGLPENGPARFSLLAGWVTTAFSLAVLTAVAVLPPKEWPQPWREVLFVEGAEPLVFKHPGIVRGLSFKEDSSVKVGFRFPWPMNEARAGVFEGFGQKEQARQGQIQLEQARIRLQQAKLQKQQSLVLQARNYQQMRHLQTLFPQFEPLKSIPSNDTKPMLLALTGDHAVQHWNIQTGALQKQWANEHQGEALASKRESLDSVVSPDGELTLVFDDEKTLRVLATEQLKELKEAESERKSVVDEIENLKSSMNKEAAGLNATGRAGTGPVWMALKNEVTLLNNQLAIIDERIKISSNQPESVIGELLRHEHKIVDAIFSHDGRQIATATEDGIVRLWSAQIAVTVGEPMPHETPINQAAYNYDGSRIVTVSGNVARLWDAQDGTSQGGLMQHEDEIFQAAFSPDDKRLITISRDKTVRFWDVLNDLSLGELQLYNGWIDKFIGQLINKWIKNSVFNIAVFSPDGKFLVAASDDNTVQLRDARSGTALGKFMRHEDNVNSAMFSPDGEQVVTASDDKNVSLWDGRTGEPIGKPMKHDNKVRYAAFSPDGKRIATMSEGNVVRLWNAQTGQPLGIAMRHESNIWNISFSPDGNRIITASSDNAAQQWDAQTGAPLGQPLQHEYAVRQSSYSPDGRRIITGGDDGTVRLWDAETNALLGVLPAPGRVGTAVFHPNKDQVLIARSAKDGEARIWRIPPYPAAKPAFEFVQDHLKTIAIFS